MCGSGWALRDSTPLPLHGSNWQTLAPRVPNLLCCQRYSLKACFPLLITVLSAWGNTNTYSLSTHLVIHFTTGPPSSAPWESNGSAGWPNSINVSGKYIYHSSPAQDQSKKIPYQLILVTKSPLIYKQLAMLWSNWALTYMKIYCKRAGSCIYILELWAKEMQASSRWTVESIGTSDLISTYIVVDKWWYIGVATVLIAGRVSTLYSITGPTGCLSPINY